MSILGENIKKLRERAGYSIRKLSEVSGVSKSVICEIESGKAKNPRFETISKIAISLNVTPETLNDMEFEHEYVVTDVKEAFYIIINQPNLTINGEKITPEAKLQLVNSIKMALQFVEETQEKSKNNN
ncbi:transcriptional regulator with XRE-family HTH domain [Ruminiclostridium sufflavum DSM 19573]|uniref:Transcriptional regulator with XRE-family HTH domain n=1 Tax=Ruminiclostridium sufflavum DSM 19573 TaxID=1121337 RepID=A0A318XFD4_9FIRM|nr:helix-turn-helix transcriptional regulator [Ruminiclostridium sufflavum]PYG84268.1 transcriptional regulator with XRE-family HTH domain [Ruminiclostridium sufflavum DSM 19573]